MNELPIYEIEYEILNALKNRNRVIIEAPTGSGKTTQVPQMLLKSSVCEGTILCLQPRRLAARMLAARVARETGTRTGELIGYQVRFDTKSSAETRVLYITEGILLRRLLSDPTLDGVGAVIFDEFHERSIHTDVGLARIRRLQEEFRPDLKLLVMSATLNTAPVAEYLRDAPAVRSAGRAFPVTIEYLDRMPNPEKPVWSVTVGALENYWPMHDGGDVLVFMPGAYEISRTVSAIRESPVIKNCDVVALHGELSPEAQDAAVGEHFRTRIVVATNIAETSLTIEGVTLVVDSGLARIAKHDPHRDINALYIERISKASADQRAGRAGRVRAGRCIRLWTQRDHDTRADTSVPEIRRIDLTETLLALHAGGLKNPDEFPWFEPPDAKQLERAETLLLDLGAIDPETGEITETGRSLVSFPVHPRYGRMLLAGNSYECVPTAAIIAALTQERSILLSRLPEHVLQRRNRAFAPSPDSDLIQYIGAFAYIRSHGFSVDHAREVGVHAGAARTVEKTARRFLDIAEKNGLDIVRDFPTVETVAKCILEGFSDRLAVRPSFGSLRCELVHGRSGELSRETSVKKSGLLVACDITEIEGRRNEFKTRLSTITAVREEWLQELFPRDFHEHSEPMLDSATKRVQIQTRRVFRDLVLESSMSSDVSDEVAADVLARAVLDERLNLPSWNHAVQQLVARINCASEWCPEWEFPPFDNDAEYAVLQQVCLGAKSRKDLKNRDVLQQVTAWLSQQQQACLDKHLPERLELKNGTRVKITYTTGEPPVASVQIQRLYDVAQTPTIACGRVKVLLHILAPNQRPVQVTDDLSRFWDEHYPEIKKQLKGRYPKHEWR